MANLQEVVDRLKTIEEMLTVAKPPPVDLREAAAYLHLSKQTLYRMTSKSEIAHYKTGKKLFFLREQLDAYITKNRVRPRGEM